ncbi:retrovirus-related Pol polyprotein from transposon 297 [Trichonephila clavipes]|nr:retrovirus-related Pol polyprotein from transposon 297 [Trichonephila clavipes]
MSPPILKQAVSPKPFLIRTDASNYALGAVLLQGEDKEEHPVEFASRLLNPAERNYSTTEREALAVVWALNKFRGYIDGASITVASDHQPLRWLMKLKSPTGRLARWALQLQSFNLNMEYIPGKMTNWLQICYLVTVMKKMNCPSGLLLTPVPAQRFETLAIDLFGPYTGSKDGRWILIIEDCTASGSNCLHYPMQQLKNVPLP